jgi:4-amino-4-deoxy-L-arabinose transferase-like glycosyltransferase
LLAFLYGLLLIFLTERLTARFTDDPLTRAMPIAVLAIAGVSSWPMPSHHWVVDLLQLGALLLLLSALRGEKTAGVGTAAGVLSALGCFTLQHQGAYLVLALIFFFFPWIEDKRLRRALFFGGRPGGWR